jgi:small-conductance mechanosensitive channel
VILLLDRSVKPGDVIAIGDTYGWVNSMGARFVALVTRDGIEHLIPNEDFITQRVENWSYSSSAIRLHCSVGIAYDSDVRRALALLLDAAHETERVLSDRAPNALVMGFGDSSIDLELRFWIGDPQNGISNVRSEVYLRMWDKFRENGVVIPFPQRDVHIRTGSDAK